MCWIFSASIRHARRAARAPGARRRHCRRAGPQAQQEDEIRAHVLRNVLLRLFGPEPHSPLLGRRVVLAKRVARGDVRRTGAADSHPAP